MELVKKYIIPLKRNFMYIFFLNCKYILCVVYLSCNNFFDVYLSWQRYFMCRLFELATIYYALFI